MLFKLVCMVCRILGLFFNKVFILMIFLLYKEVVFVGGLW